MKRGYLVLTNDLGSVVAKKPHALKEPNPAEARALVESAYPGHEIYDQLTKCPKGCLIVTTYTSPSPEGMGRSGSKFYQWAIKEIK